MRHRVIIGSATSLRQSLLTTSDLRRGPRGPLQPFVQALPHGTPSVPVRDPVLGTQGHAPPSTGKDALVLNGRWKQDTQDRVGAAPEPFDANRPGLI